LLNGSNARTYKLAWSSSSPLKVIGTDGGLLAAAVTRPYIMLMPGERIDLWVDFSSQEGKTIVLKSLAFDPGGMGMMGMGGGMGGRGMQGMGGMNMMGSTLPQGSEFDILKVNVGKKAATSPVLGSLPPIPGVLSAADVPNWSRPRVFTISMGHMMSWLINGRTYDMNNMTATALDEQFYSGGAIAWEWVNNSMLPHPMHIHNIHFQVVERTPSPLASYATINQGLVDEGLKDTVLVWPGERVKTVMKFGPHTGLYMYHCHILEHEDMGMMRNFSIS
jgi:FtsP/CotA-like multicopper oxidase with cupredoxin domain